MSKERLCRSIRPTILFLFLTPLVLLGQQPPGIPAERVPTARLRSDTFPRWQTPTLINQNLVAIPGGGGGGNPRAFTANPAGGSYMDVATDLAVDSRGVVHIVGAWTSTQQGSTANGVYYITNRFDQRTASGFSAPLRFTQNNNYTLAGGARVCADSNDNIHIVWTAGWGNGVGGGSTAQGARAKSDIFRVQLNDQGWSANPIQVTSAACGNLLMEGYGSLELAADGSGNVWAAGIRSQQEFVWNSQTSQWDSIWYRNGNEPYPTVNNQLVYWSSLTTSGAPASIGPNTTATVGSISINASGSTLVTYSAYTNNGGWSLHGYGLPTTGTPLTDVCGAQGWPFNTPAPPAGGYFGSIHGDLDAMGTPHFVYQRDFGGTTTYQRPVYHRMGTATESAVSLQINTSIGGCKALVDSRDQIHVTYSAPVAWQSASNGGNWHPFYAARVKNPSTSQLNSTWSRQDLIAAPLFDQSSFDATVGSQLWGFESGWPQRAVIDSQDRIHVLDTYISNPTYTCTMEYQLGVRDSAAMASAFPGAAVNVTNGNLSFALNLFSTQGVSPNQSVSLIYNSMDSEFGSIAQGWKLNCQAYLIDHGLALNDPRGTYSDQRYESITVAMPDGRRIHFGFTSYSEGNQNLCYLVAYDEFGFFAKLQRTNWEQLGGNYEMTFKNGDKWIFDGNGRLVEMRSRAGNSVFMIYQSGRLVEIRDQVTSAGGSGRSTEIIYDSAVDYRRPARIWKVRDPNYTYYECEYANNRLTGVVFPEYADHNFTYYTSNNPSTGARSGLMSSYMTPMESPWTLRYLQDGRLSQVVDPQVTIVPEGIASSPTLYSPFLSIYYDEPSPPTSDPYINGLDRVTRIYDRRGFPWRYEYESRRNLVKEVYDPTILDVNANPTSGPTGVVPVLRAFNSFGSLTSERNRTGSTTSYSYYAAASSPHVWDDLQTVSRDAINLASYAYYQDGYHQVQTATTYASSSSRVTSHSYDSAGRLEGVSLPQALLADGTTQSASRSYVYGGPRGALSQIVDEEGNSTVFSNFHSVHGLPKATLRPGGTQTEDRDYNIMGLVTQQRRPQGGQYNDAPGWTSIAFDGLYRVSVVTDPLSCQTHYTYDTDSRLTSVTPPAGSSTTYYYDARGFQTGGSGPDGTWANWPDASGNLRRYQDLRGFFSDKEYDALSRVVTERTESGSGGYGGGGPTYSTASYSHDQIVNGQRAVLITQSGTGNPRVTTQLLDSWDRVASTTQPDNQTSQVTFYDQQGGVLATESRYNGALQTCTVFFRDARDRVYLTRRQDAGYGSQPTWTEDTYTQFNKTGGVVMSVGPRGDPTNSSILTDKVIYELDERNRIFRVYQPHDGTMQAVQECIYGDDDLILETKVPDPTGATSNMATSMKYTYTGRKEQKTAKNSSGYGLSYAYNALPGQVDTVTDAGNVVTKSTYHSTTQRTNEVIRAYGTGDYRRIVHNWTNGFQTEKLVWNPQSQTESASWSYGFDREGRLERLGAPQSAAEVYSYSAYGETTGVVAGQRSESRGYNSLGAETSRTISGAFSGQFSKGYDGNGNLTQVNDGSLRKDIAWDVQKGRCTSESHYIGGNLWKSQTYGHDDAGNLSTMTYPDPATTIHQWVRDDAGRVTDIYVGTNSVCTMAYTQGGLLRQTTLRNSQGAAIAQTVHSFDSLGRRVRSHVTNATSQSTLSDLRWEYDNLDRITKITYFHLGIETVIGYNVHGEVTSESTSGNSSGMSPPSFTNSLGGPPTGNVSNPSGESESTPGVVLSLSSRSASYSYDRGGNRIGQTIDGVSTTLTYDTENRLLTESRTGWAAVHEYDDWGNEVERTTTTSTTTTVETYGYNALSRLSSYTKTVNSSLQANWQYEYWPSGERFAKINLSSNTSQRFVCMGDNVVAEYGVTSGGSVSLQNTYAQGLGLDQKSVRITAGGSRTHYLGDMVGTLTATLTDSGNLSETAIRDVWGNTLSGDTDNERYGFSQREHDGETGLVYMRYRLYDSRVGRFIQLDPIQSRRSDSHYKYGRNNPTGFTDPSGQYEEDVHEYLTRYLAQAAGFPEAIAKLIGRATQALDEDDRSAFNPEMAPRFHFMGEEQLGKLRETAFAKVNGGSWKEIGEWLHALEDSYSHQTDDKDRDFSTTYKGDLYHGLEGHNPDQTWRRPALTLKMAKTVFDELSSLAKEYKAKGGTLEKQANWSDIVPTVGKFAMFEPKLYTEFAEGAKWCDDVVDYSNKVSILFPSTTLKNRMVDKKAYYPNPAKTIGFVAPRVINKAGELGAKAVDGGQYVAGRLLTKVTDFGDWLWGIR